MTLTETKKFIRKTYELFRDEYSYTQNDFCELIGMDRQNFNRICQPSHVHSFNLTRAVRRLCHLLVDIHFREHAVEWCKEVKAMELDEHWHGSIYTKQLHRREKDYHKSRRAKEHVVSDD